jgi:hypothetical protein
MKQVYFNDIRESHGSRTGKKSEKKSEKKSGLTFAHRKPVGHATLPIPWIRTFQKWTFQKSPVPKVRFLH